MLYESFIARQAKAKEGLGFAVDARVLLVEDGAVQHPADDIPAGVERQEQRPVEALQAHVDHEELHRAQARRRI